MVIKPRLSEVMSKIGAYLFACLLSVMLGVGSAAAGARSDAVQKIKSNGYHYLIEPIPEWVVPASGDTTAQLSRAPLSYPVVDEQILADNGDATFFHHIERVVNEPAGLEPAAQIQIAFDPAYEVLALHKLCIWRDGRRIEKLDRKRVQLLQRETMLEYQIYDGRVTASIVLDDVRVGDRIEYAFSIHGLNPVFEGKLVFESFMGSAKGPVTHYQLRLLAPENRKIFHRAAPAVEVTSNTLGDKVETIFRRNAIPQFQDDPDAPDSAYLSELIQLSEFGSWAEVAHWGSRLFQLDSQPSMALSKAADPIRSTPAPLERLERSLDFVQKEVRYFGTEIGSNSHRPAAPDRVIKQRFGDCKDKTALLIALLKEAGIEASPVLVSTRYRGELEMTFPTPLAFNHVIARVEIEGGIYWLDGTRSHQTGPLVERQSMGLGRGLILRADADSLTELPGTRAEERIAVEDMFRIKQFSEAPILESRITYSGELAEYVRQVVASQPPEQIATQMAADYLRLFPKIKSDAALRIEELQGRNAVSIVQQFTVPGFWSFPEQQLLYGETSFWNLVQALRYPNTPSRQRSFRIQSPGVYRHAVTFDFPDDISRTGDSKQVDERDPHFEFHVKYDTSPRRVQMQAELRLLKESVVASDWPAYVKKLDKVKPMLGGYVSAPVIPLTQSERLKEELREIERSARKVSIWSKRETPTQLRARARRLVLTFQLDSGRLEPELRAEALHARGVQLDFLDMADVAAADFEEALRLVPDNAKFHEAAATNALIRGRYPDALALAEKALQLDPSETAPYLVHADSLYFTGDYAGAKKDLLALLDSPAEVERSYSALRLYLTARRLGEDGVEAVKEYRPSDSSPSWPYPVLQFFIGEEDYEHALKGAKEEQNALSRLCELYYFAGEKYLVDGDKRRAKEYFQKSIDTGVKEFTEYALSKHRLEEMAAY